MLVHYAVDTKKVIGSVKPSEVIVPHGCEGLDEAVAKLAKDFQVNVVIHGHLHSPALYNHSGAQVIACTTTTQQNGHRGFFLMKFLDTGELRVEHHVWNGAAFAADPNKSLNKPFVTGVAA
jgi:predicted phosphodiesterase